MSHAAIYYGIYSPGVLLPFPLRAGVGAGGGNGGGVGLSVGGLDGGRLGTF